LSFELTLSGATRKNTNNKHKTKESILDLKEKLITIGYNPGEVEYLVKRFGHNKGLSELGESELNELKKALQNRLCQGITRGVAVGATHGVKGVVASPGRGTVIDQLRGHILVTLLGQ